MHAFKFTGLFIHSLNVNDFHESLWYQYVNCDWSVQQTYSVNYFILMIHHNDFIYDSLYADNYEFYFLL